MSTDEGETVATQLVVRAYTNGSVEIGLPRDVVSAIRLLEMAVKAIADKIEQAKKEQALKGLEGSV